jgi:tetratricopeptide (TPR) repeat protein
MAKFGLFALLWYLTGSPIIAILVLLAVGYFLDRRFIGLTPSLTKPFKRRRRLAVLLGTLRLNPHDTSAKLEAARLYIEMRRYRDALSLLQEAYERTDESPEVLYDIGLCRLMTGAEAEGESLILQSLEANPRIRYGEPYLRLGEALAISDPTRAAAYLEQFRSIQSSSCEAYYRLALLYKRLGRTAESRDALRETLELYRGLPAYMRRLSRRWALLAWLRLRTAG